MRRLLVVTVTGGDPEVERPASLAECDDLLRSAHALYRRADRNGSVMMARSYYAVRDQLLEFRRQLQAAPPGAAPTGSPGRG